MTHHMFTLEQEKQMRAVLARCALYASEGERADPDGSMMYFAESLVDAAKEVQAILDATIYYQRDTRNGSE